MNESQSILHSIIYLKGEKKRSTQRKQQILQKEQKRGKKNDCGVNGFAAFKGE